MFAPPQSKSGTTETVGAPSSKETLHPPRGQSREAATSSGASFDWSRIALFPRSPEVGALEDPLEQEAERLAEQVVRAPAPPPASPRPSAIPAPPASGLLSEPGRPLDAATRAWFEPRFGFDFSRIRIHSGPRAAEAAQALNARAFALGSDVVFGAGQFEPGDSRGRRLLAHELAHVTQQATVPTPVIRRQPAPTPVPQPGPPQQQQSGQSPDEEPGFLEELAERLEGKIDEIKHRLELLQQLFEPNGNWKLLVLLVGGSGILQGGVVGGLLSTAALAALVYRLHQELEDEGLFGPVMQLAISSGLLPEPPADFGKRKMLQVRWFILMNKPDSVFFHLNGLEMIDMIDVLRQLPAEDVTFFQEHLAKEGAAWGPASVARMGMALDAVKGTFTPASPEVVPQDQQDKARGYTERQNWLTLLPRANRTKEQAITLANAADKKKNGGKPLNIPDIGKSPDDLRADQAAIVEIIRRNRQRLGTRMSEGNKRGIGYSYGGNLSQDVRPGSLVAPDAPNKTRDQEVDEALYTELGSEGSASAVATQDSAILTLGHGLAHIKGPRGGALEGFIRKLFQQDPDFRIALLEAGITYAKDPLAPTEPSPAPAGKGKAPAKPPPEVWDWFVVNTDAGVVEQGDNALQLLRLDPQLLSVYINLAESPEHSKVVSEAQWQQMKAHDALKVPAYARKWPLETIRFCAHFVYWGAKSSWSKTFPESGSGGGDFKTALTRAVQWLAANTSYVEVSGGTSLVREETADHNFPSTVLLSFADYHAIKTGLVERVEGLPSGNAIFFDMTHSRTRNKGMWRMV